MRSKDGFVSTDAGIRLFARTVGGGPETVLVPNGIHLLEDFAHLGDGRTLVFYDLRNRGRSDTIDDPAALAGGVDNDAADLDSVRRHAGAERVDIIGHSYLGLTAILYALAHPDRVNRIVQLSPIQPDQSATYPPELTNADETLRDVMAGIAGLQKERGALDPVDFCAKFWDRLRPLYVARAADAHRIRWDRCDLANERGFMKYWIEHVVPSMRRLALTRDRLAPVTAPVLTIHGRKDRSSPYGAGLDWARMLPNARLITIDNAAHAPWIEEPDAVFGAIRTFLDGGWPEAARPVG